MYVRRVDEPPEIVLVIGSVETQPESRSQYCDDRGDAR